MSAVVTCTHCLLEIKRNSAIHETINGEEVFFCCHGCQSVYHVLKGEGLEQFYSKRQQDWQPGPPEQAHVSDDLFLESITEKEGGETEVVFLLSGIRCASCIWLVERFLGKTEGVTHVRVNYATHKAKIRWRKEKISLAEILRKVTDIGYCPLPQSTDAAASMMEKERKDYFYRFSIGAFFTMQIMMYTVALYAGYFQGMDSATRLFLQLVAWLLATPVMVYSGYPFIKNSIRSLRNRTVNMDTLVFLGSAGAYFYSIIAIFTGREVYFDTSSMIITLILLGRFIESGAKVKAGNAVARLLSLQPQQVRKLESFSLESYEAGMVEAVIVHVKQVAGGDFIEILPGDTVPVDGRVISGRSDVDQSMLTGESAPVLKVPGAPVFTGTSNLNGPLVVEAGAVGPDTMLAKIAAAVEEAQERKAPIQAVADRVVGYFVPAIISIAFVTFGLWSYLGKPFLAAFMNAVSVLVIACPCALGLATPLAILIATGRIAKQGIIIKSGETIEKLNTIDTFCFDKTGTVTRGALKAVEIQTVGAAPEKIHQLAASVEKHSRHLAARAVVEAFDGALLPVRDFTEHPGKGVTAEVAGQSIIIGNRRFMEEKNVLFSREAEAVFQQQSKSEYSIVCVAVNHRLAGLITLTDSLRDEAGAVLTAISREGETVILTGDNRASAARLARRLDIPDLQVKAELTPIDKVSIIEKYRNAGKHVAMVGDGINDAPALTEADVGIAMGKGTDIALESADAVLIRGDLRAIPGLMHIARRTFSVIKQNLFWAFSYNIVAVPLAVAGIIHPIVSAAFMSISSLLVVFNSLRINRIKAVPKVS